MQLKNKLAYLLLGALLLPMLANPVAAQDLDALEDIEDEMQDLRELDLSDPLDITFMTRDEFIESLESDSDEEQASESGGAYQQVLVAFGFIEDDQDPDEIYSGLIGEQVAGYYDPETNEMVVILSGEGDEPSVFDLVTFAHETVHAIQDQNFDLNSYDEIRLEGTQDTYLSVTALIEGDATLALLDYLLANPDVAADYLAAVNDDSFESGALDSAPGFFVATLAFPYNQGFEFVQVLHEEGGWDLVNDAYDNPPTTSEQILHPGKYFDGEEAIDVEVPDIEAALGDGWQVADSDTFGEFVISVLLEDAGLNERQIERAHSGWGGDAYVAATNNDEVAVTWATAWDSADDADEFFRALVVRESGRIDGDAEQDGDTVTIRGNDAVVQVILDGETVTWLYGPDLDAVEVMAGSL